MKARMRTKKMDPHSKEALAKFSQSLTDEQTRLVGLSVEWTKQATKGLKMGIDYEVDQEDIKKWESMVNSFYDWQRDIYNAMLNTVRVTTKQALEEEFENENGAPTETPLQ